MRKYCLAATLSQQIIWVASPYFRRFSARRFENLARPMHGRKEMAARALMGLLMLSASITFCAGCDGGHARTDAGNWGLSLSPKEQQAFAGTDVPRIAQETLPALEKSPAYQLAMDLISDCEQRFLLVAARLDGTLSDGKLKRGSPSLERLPPVVQNQPAIIAVGCSPRHIRVVGNVLPRTETAGLDDWTMGVTEAPEVPPAVYSVEIPWSRLSESQKQDFRGLTQRIFGPSNGYEALVPAPDESTIVFLRTSSQGSQSTYVVSNLECVRWLSDLTSYSPGIKKVAATSRLVSIMLAVNSLFKDPLTSVEMEHGLTFQSGRRVWYTKCSNNAADCLYPARRGRNYARPWGYIDQAGQWVIPNAFEEADGLAEGAGSVLHEGMWRFVDRQGRYLTERGYDDVAPFAEGRARVKDGRFWGFIDSSGKEVVKPVHAAAGDYAGGLAPAKTGTGSVDLGGLWGYIDRDGAWAIQPQFVEAYEFTASGLAMVSPDGHYGYVDRKGRLVIEAEYDIAGDFSEGLAFVHGRRFTGYIDTSARGVIPLPEAGLGMVFRQGVAPVRLSPDGQWGLIDTTGRLIVQPAFDVLLPVTEGLAPFARERKWGYIDCRGTVMIAARFSRAGPFCGGLAEVEEDELVGYINRDGKYVWREGM